MRAKFVKVIDITDANIRFLWKVTSETPDSMFASHVVTSSATWGTVNETMAFWADENGEVLDWGGIARVDSPHHHVECLLDAGFEVIGLE